MQRTDSLEKTLMLGKIEGRRKRGWQRMRWLDGITDSMEPESEQALGVGYGQGSLACCSPWGHRVGHDWATELTEADAGMAGLKANLAVFFFNDWNHLACHWKPSVIVLCSPLPFISCHLLSFIYNNIKSPVVPIPQTWKALPSTLPPSTPAHLLSLGSCNISSMKSSLILTPSPGLGGFQGIVW